MAVVTVPVAEFLIQYTWGETEVVPYNPRKHNHFQSRKIAEDLGFECPTYPQETADGFAVYTRLISKKDVVVVRKRIDLYLGSYQMASVEMFNGTFERITFTAEGYTLDQFEKETSQVIELEEDVYEDHSYSNGVGRWADHR